MLEQNPVEELVQDYANVLSTTEVETLTEKLNEFNRTTSNQILVVVVTNLCGYDKAEFTYSLGQKWGVGQDNKDNGVVIMVKPKTDTEKGAVFIAPGYGLEGALPDAIVKRIIENQVIPLLKDGDYYLGISNAIDKVMEASLGEYSEIIEEEESSYFWWIVLGIILAIILFFVLDGFIRKTKWTLKIRKEENVSYAEAKLIRLEKIKQLAIKADKKTAQLERNRKSDPEKHAKRQKKRLENKRRRGEPVYINSSDSSSSIDNNSFDGFSGGDFGGGGAGGEW